MQATSWPRECPGGGGLGGVLYYLAKVKVHKDKCGT